MDNEKLNGYVKGLLALVVAVLSALTAAVTGKTDFADIDNRTWLIALGAVLASGALTAFVTNVAGVAGGIIKAVVAAFGAAVAALVASLDDQVLTQVEILTAISAFVVGLSIVYEVPEPGADMESAEAPVTTKEVPRAGSARV